MRWKFRFVVEIFVAVSLCTFITLVIWSDLGTIPLRRLGSHFTSHIPGKEISKRVARVHRKWGSSVKYHVGVLSSRKYLGTRAEGVYHTWGKEAASLSFYVGDVPVSSSLPVTVLRGVNDSTYPPQHKSFELMRYWCNNYLGQYDWFVKADDDAYVKVALLERLLQGLDSNIKYYIGRSALGFPFERKALSLYNNMYCGGPTVIFSKAVMKGLCPHIDSCMSHVATAHEDTEVGRCVIFKVGVQCHAGTNTSRLFITTANKEVFGENLLHKPKLREVMSAHEVKEPANMYNLHFQYHKWLRTAKLDSAQYQGNPFGIKSLKSNLSQEVCRKVNCTFEQGM